MFAHILYSLIHSFIHEVLPELNAERDAEHFLSRLRSKQAPRECPEECSNQGITHSVSNFLPLSSGEFILATVEHEEKTNVPVVSIAYLS